MLSATERLTELFQKHLDGGLSPEEKQELSLYAMQEDLQPLLQELIAASWHKTGEEADLSPEKVEAAKRYILSEDKEIVREIAPRTSLRTKWWWAAAAIFIFAVAGSTFWYFQHHHVIPAREPVLAEDIKPGGNGAILTLSDGRRIELNTQHNSVVTDRHGVEAVVRDGKLHYKSTPPAKGNVMYHTVTTPRGKQFQMQLPDGSRVWLNTASSITYPTSFGEQAREVSVTGEVYFDVSTMASAHPFVVTSHQQRVKVLSTSFNVNSYEDDATVKTTLRDGKVRVETELNTDTKVLLPGQQSLVAGGSSIQVREVNIDQVLAWQMGYFNFTNASFAEIMQQLSRWYDIEVKYAHTVPHIEFEGRLNQSVNLSRVLEFFRESGVQFRMENHTLTIL